MPCKQEPPFADPLLPVGRSKLRKLGYLDREECVPNETFSVRSDGWTVADSLTYLPASLTHHKRMILTLVGNRLCYSTLLVMGVIDRCAYVFGSGSL